MAFNVVLDYFDDRTYVTNDDLDIWDAYDCTARDIHYIYSTVALANLYEIPVKELVGILIDMKCHSKTMG